MFPFFFSRKINLPHTRLELNNGIVTLNEQRSLISTPPYDKGAAIPKDNFFGIERLMLKPISTYSNAYLGSNAYVGLFCFKQLFEELNYLGVHEVKTYSELVELRQSKAFQDGVTHILKVLTSVFEIFQELTFLGVHIKASGSPTSTINPQTKTRLGLHIDSWDRKHLDKRGNCRNRICFNIGSKPRYLLFINKNIADIVEEDIQQSYLEQENIVYLRNYMSTNTNIQVTRLLIQPGEAYIAPTENMIHDGFTFSNVEPDITLTFLGNIRIKDTEKCIAFKLVPHAAKIGIANSEA